MLIITLNLPNIQVDTLAKLVEGGRYPNRSEAVRVAVGAFLKTELRTVEALLDFTEKGANVPQKPALVQQKLDSCKARIEAKPKPASSAKPARASVNLSDETIDRIKKQLELRP